MYAKKIPITKLSLTNPSNTQYELGLIHVPIHNSALLLLILYILYPKSYLGILGGSFTGSNPKNYFFTSAKHKTVGKHEHNIQCKNPEMKC